MYTHMDFMSPPTFGILNIQTWKVKIFLYLKALGIHVYFSTIKDSYCLNGKHLEANAKTIHALKSTLSDDYLCRISNFDSAFIVWNTLSSLGEQMSYDKETRMKEMILPTYATWSKGMTPLR